MNVSVLPQLPNFLPEPNGGALQFFSMSLTKLAYLPKSSFSQFLDLMHIDLSSNELSMIDAMAFEKLPSLAELSLRQNKLTYLPDTLFDNIPNVFSLDLSMNRLTEIPVSVERLVNLKTLNLHANPLHCPCSIVNLAIMMPKLEETVGRASCASPPEVSGRAISDLGRQYVGAFKGTVHLGFTADPELYPETDTQLKRSNTNWPMPHCNEEDLGGRMTEKVEDNKSQTMEAPSIALAPTAVALSEGERAFFVCEGAGWPLPKTTWTLPTNTTTFVRFWNRRQVNYTSVFPQCLQSITTWMLIY